MCIRGLRNDFRSLRNGFRSLQKTFGASETVSGASGTTFGAPETVSGAPDTHPDARNVYPGLPKAFPSCPTRVWRVALSPSSHPAAFSFFGKAHRPLPRPSPLGGGAVGDGGRTGGGWFQRFLFWLQVRGIPAAVPDSQNPDDLGIDPVDDPMAPANVVPIPACRQEIGGRRPHLRKLLNVVNRLQDLYREPARSLRAPRRQKGVRRLQVEVSQARPPEPPARPHRRTTAPISREPPSARPSGLR